MLYAPFVAAAWAFAPTGHVGTVVNTVRTTWPATMQMGPMGPMGPMGYPMGYPMGRGPMQMNRNGPGWNGAAAPDIYGANSAFTFEPDSQIGGGESAVAQRANGMPQTPRQRARGMSSSGDSNPKSAAARQQARQQQQVGNAQQYYDGNAYPGPADEMSAQARQMQAQAQAQQARAGAGAAGYQANQQAGVANGQTSQAVAQQAAYAAYMAAQQAVQQAGQQVNQPAAPNQQQSDGFSTGRGSFVNGSGPAAAAQRERAAKARGEFRYGPENNVVGGHTSADVGKPKSAEARRAARGITDDFGPGPGGMGGVEAMYATAPMPPQQPPMASVPQGVPSPQGIPPPQTPPPQGVPPPVARQPPMPVGARPASPPGCVQLAQVKGLPGLLGSAPDEVKTAALEWCFVNQVVDIGILFEDPDDAETIKNHFVSSLPLQDGGIYQMRLRKRLDEVHAAAWN